MKKMMTEAEASMQWCLNYHYFHGYKVKRDGTVLSKKGKPLKMSHRVRRGGKLDLCVTLRIHGDSVKFTASRLIAACFIGPVFGLQVNHKDRDTFNIHVDNLEIGTASQNQKHWRADDLLGK